MNPETWIRLAGLAHFGILIASAQVPFRLDWKSELASLSPLHRQMYWIYGAYTAFSIVAFGVISLAFPDQLADGSGLSRAFCGYVAIFWGVRLVLQAVMNVSEHLTAWWLRAGYHGLTVVFLFLTAVFGWIALR